MSQSGFIAGIVLAAFIFWLAANDRLTAYTNALWGSSTAKPTPTSPTGGGVGAPGAAPGGGGGGIFDSLPGLGDLLGDGGGAAGLLESAGPLLLA